MDAAGEVEKADWLGGTRRPVPGGRYKRLSLAHNPASAPTCDQDKAQAAAAFHARGEPQQRRVIRNAGEQGAGDLLGGSLAG